MLVQFSCKQYCQLSQILKLFLFQIVYVSIIGDREEAENSDDVKETQKIFLLMILKKNWRKSKMLHFLVPRGFKQLERQGMMV